MESIIYYFVSDEAKYRRYYTMMLCYILILPRIPLAHTLPVESIRVSKPETFSPKRTQSPLLLI